MDETLQQLVVEGVLKSFVYKEDVPTMEGDTISRLVDKLTLEFPNGKKLNLTTTCSGCLENSSIMIDEYANKPNYEKDNHE